MTSTVRVLHVDDDPEFADLTAEFLEREREHFDVVTEHSPTAALSRLDTEPVDCIVSDYQMPPTDGLEFLDTVRDDSPDLPFILFTNQGSEQVAAEAIETGVTSYLQKETGGTVQYAMLANRIQNHVEKYRAERRARTARREYELVARTATDVFWTVELPHETVAFGDGLGHFGYDADALDREVDLDWFFDHVHPDDRERIREQYERLLAREASAFDELRAESDEFSTGLRFERADGTYADCRGRGVVLFEDGEPTEIVGTMTDVSEHVERERELEATIEASPDAIILIDEDGIAQRWNPAAERLFGWTAEEVVGEPLPAVPPEEETAVNEIRERLLDEDADPITGYETQRQHKDGSVIDVSVSTAPVRDSRGDVVGTVAVVEDISDRKAAERELQRERDRLRALFENTPDPIMEVSFEDGTPLIDAVNPAFARTFGVDAGDAVGRTVAETVVPDGEHDEHERLKDRVFQGEPVETEVRRETASGVREFVLRIIPIDVDDVSSGAYAWYTDVTDRRERERELRQVKERFQRVFEESNDAIMIVDMDCEAFVEVNRAACEMLGYTREELLALDPGDIHPDDIDRVREEFLSEVYETGTGWTDDITCMTKDGEEIPTEISGARLRLDADTDAGGEAEGGSPKMVAVLRDISGQVAYERELERQARELERQNERLEKFVDTVSHDLRNPLNVASGRLELATDECDSEHLAPVADALDRMETLIEDLLTLARQGETPAEIEAVDLADVVEASWQNVETAGATLRLDADRTVRADRSRLMQLFENLIRNSVEHGSTGSAAEPHDSVEHGSTGSRPEADDAVEHGGGDVTVTVGAFEDGFYVADDGPGIDPDDREQVFDSGYSTTTGGTGFGLSIVEEIVDAHGWDIQVTESESGGARFDVTDCTVLD